MISKPPHQRGRLALVARRAGTLHATHELELEGDRARCGTAGRYQDITLDLLERLLPIATFMDFCTELEELRLQGARPRPH